MAFYDRSPAFSDLLRLFEQERLKSLPAFYDADGLTTQQHFATSADGTKVRSTHPATLPTAACLQPSRFFTGT